MVTTDIDGGQASVKQPSQVRKCSHQKHPLKERRRSFFGIKRTSKQQGQRASKQQGQSQKKRCPDRLSADRQRIDSGSTADHQRTVSGRLPPEMEVHSTIAERTWGAYVATPLQLGYICHDRLATKRLGSGQHLSNLYNFVILLHCNDFFLHVCPQIWSCKRVPKHI